jgi:hypothetical protein
VDNERHAYSVPELMREQFVTGDGFAQRLSQATGWSVFSHRPIYTDPLVIHQPWLRAPSQRLYTDRAFYHLFAEQSFRSVLRLLLARDRVTHEDLLRACWPPERQADYLAFLHDQDMLLQSKDSYLKGPALLPIHDLGHTLEAWVAEWLRRFAALRGLRLTYPPGCIPVRHGVQATELVGAGDPGDLDVVALFPHGLILVECKSSLLQVDLAAWQRFAWRVAFLEPAGALWLIDTPDAQSSKAFRAVQRRLLRWNFTEEAPGRETIRVFRHTGPFRATSPTGHTLVRQAGTIYAALVGQEHSLEETLETILQRIVQAREEGVFPAEA